MKILIASDSYKGSLTSEEVGNAVTQGIHAVIKDADVSVIKVADGGEGTVDAIISQTHGRYVTCDAQDPQGQIQRAQYGIMGDIAIIECASASGIDKLDKTKIEHATSFGTGMLMLDAINRGCKTLYIGLGGSGTNDAGMGLLSALGYRFLDEQKCLVPPGIVGLQSVHSVDSREVSNSVLNANIVILCDVENPLYGKKGATYIFGPQKGVIKENIERYDRALEHFADVLVGAGYKNSAHEKGSGAAGGMAFACLSVLGAKMKSGVETVLDLLNVEPKFLNANLVITGEGRMDYQTAYGKLPIGIAKRAIKYNVPCIAIVGSLGEGYEEIYAHGIVAVESSIVEPCKLEDALKDAYQNVVNATERIMRKIQLKI